MKLKCPHCGHGASIIDFANEESARQAIYLAADLPKTMGRLMLQYIGLFRPSTRSLSWDRTLKLMQQLKADIDRGKIERHSRIWPAPEAQWCNAFTIMLNKAQAGTLTLPLKNHGYLYEIIASAQNTAEATIENKKEQQRQQKTAKPRKTVTKDLTKFDRQVGEHSMTQIFKHLKIKKDPKKRSTS